MKEILLLFNSHWKDNFLKTELKVRKRYHNKIIEKLNFREIIFLTGIRRIGKTTLIKQTINYLIQEKKVESKKILFVSCDNLLFSNNTIFDIIDEYRKLYEIRIDEEFYLFIDDITYLDNFNQQLKNLYDSWNVKIVCSSSNASYLNDEKAYLTGRTTTIEVYPLTFDEYLEFKELSIHKFDTTLNTKYFEDYLKNGGIPQYVIEENPQYLVDIINSIIEKDVIAYYNIQDEKTIKKLFRLICQRIGKPTSYNKLANILNIKPETVKKYVTYLEKTFLIFPCERYSKSVNENITSPKKFYIIDTGLKNLVSSFEKGSSFENLVFIELYKYRRPFLFINYYLKDGIEIDFIIKDTILVESKYLNSECSEKQEELFRDIKVKKKVIVKNNDDLKEIVQLLINYFKI